MNTTFTINKFFDISIIHKAYKFYIYLYALNQSLPKRDYYSLGLKTEALSLEMVEMLFKANAKSGQERLEILAQTDLKLKILQTIIRACWEVKALDEKKYIRLEELLQEIGKMLGGWIKATKM